MNMNMPNNNMMMNMMNMMNMMMMNMANKMNNMNNMNMPMNNMNNMNMNNNMPMNNMNNNNQMKNNFADDTMMNNNMYQQQGFMNANNTQKINNIMGQNNFNKIENQNAVGGQAPKEVIPRLEQSITADFYKNVNLNKKLNIVFQASSGLVATLPTPPDITIKQLIRNYLNKLGLRENVLNGDIVFIHNAMIMDVNEQTPVSTKFKNISAIIVIDVKGVIAA